MILFFDTETEGLPQNWKAPVTDTQNWPRVVQLAWQLCDGDGHVVREFCSLIKPPPGGFNIESRASETHGITNEMCEADGIPISHAVSMFSEALAEASALVAHNISFDRSVLGCEFVRLGIKAVKGYEVVCTMEQGTEVARIPNSRGTGFKWPKLQELHKALFGAEFDGAHDALEDVRACARCFFEMQKIGSLS